MIFTARRRASQRQRANLYTSTAQLSLEIRQGYPRSQDSSSSSSCSSFGVDRHQAEACQRYRLQQEHLPVVSQGQSDDEGRLGHHQLPTLPGSSHQRLDGRPRSRCCPPYRRGQVSHLSASRFDVEGHNSGGHSLDLPHGRPSVQLASEGNLGRDDPRCYDPRGGPRHFATHARQQSSQGREGER